MCACVCQIERKGFGEFESVGQSLANKHPLWSKSYLEKTGLNAIDWVNIYLF